MKLYIEIKQRNHEATSVATRKIYITVESIENVEYAVIDKFVKNTTWSTLVSWKVVARLDGACDTVAKEYYTEQPVFVEAAKEYYTKDCVLIRREEAIIHSKKVA